MKASKLSRGDQRRNEQATVGAVLQTLENIKPYLVKALPEYGYSEEYITKAVEDELIALVMQFTNQLIVSKPPEERKKRNGH